MVKLARAGRTGRSALPGPGILLILSRVLPIIRIKILESIQKSCLSDYFIRFFHVAPLALEPQWLAQNNRPNVPD